MASRNEGATVDQGSPGTPPPEKKRHLLQRIFGSKKPEGSGKETLTKGKPSMEEIKKTMDKLGITPEQIKKTREMLAKIGISVEKDSSAYDANLQNALMQFQEKFGPAHPSILDVAVTQDGVTTFVENGYVQQASYGILGRGVMSVLREISEAKGGLDELKQDLVQTAIGKNTSLATTLSEEEQGKIYETLGVSPSTGFGSRAFVDVVQRFQRDNGLVADGWIGKNGPTWSKLTTLTVEPNSTKLEQYRPIPPSELTGKPTEQPRPTAYPRPSVTPPIKPVPPEKPNNTGENSERKKEMQAILEGLQKIQGLEKATLESVKIHFEKDDKNSGDWVLPDGLDWAEPENDNDWSLKLLTNYVVNEKGEIVQKESESEPAKPVESNEKWKGLSPEFKAVVSVDGKIREPSQVSEIIFEGTLSVVEKDYINTCINLSSLDLPKMENLDGIDLGKLTKLTKLSATKLTTPILLGKESGNSITKVLTNQTDGDHSYSGNNFVLADISPDKKYNYQDAKLSEIGATSENKIPEGTPDRFVTILEKEDKDITDEEIDQILSDGENYGKPWYDRVNPRLTQLRDQRLTRLSLPAIPQLASDIPKPIEGKDSGVAKEVADSWKEIQSSSLEKPWTAEPSKRQYIKTEQGVFYKSAQNTGQYWGKIDEGNSYYVAKDNKMEHVEAARVLQEDKAKILKGLNMVPGFEHATLVDIGLTIDPTDGTYILPPDSPLTWIDVKEWNNFGLKLNDKFHIVEGKIFRISDQKEIDMKGNEIGKDTPSEPEKPKDALQSSDSVELKEFDGYNVLYRKGDKEAESKMTELEGLYRKNKDRFDAIKTAYGKPLTIVLVDKTHWDNVIEQDLRGNKDDNGKPVYEGKFVGAWNYFDISPTLKKHFGQDNISGLYPGIVFQSEEEIQKFDNTFSNEFFESYASSLFHKENPTKHENEPWEETAPLQVAGWYIDYYFGEIEKKGDTPNITELVKLINSDGVEDTHGVSVGNLYKNGDKKQKLVGDLYNGKTEIPANVSGVMTTVLKQKILTYAPTLVDEVNKMSFTFNSSTKLLSANYGDYRTRGATKGAAETTIKATLDSSSPLARRIPGFGSVQPE